ncbi:MAG: hypothetical protein FWG81_02785 [Betaproteobacteria bacterium]|nr:hypothetical protein [Betaproteobacteria bacterium]
MCHFVTAIVGGSVDLARLNAIAKKHHRFFEPIKNDSVESYLQKNEVYLSTLPHRAMCDCGTSLGWLPRHLVSAPKPVSGAKIAKLQRMGWSETKISRWLQSKERDRQTWNPPSPDDLSNDKQNDNWLALAEEVLSEPAVSSFGLMVHCYRRGLEDSIPFKGREDVDLSRKALASMEDCKLYVFRK